MATNDSLTGKQRRFAMALIAAPTVDDAAELAGISQRTAYRYLQTPEVRRAVASNHDVVLGEVARRLAREMGGALDVLVGVMRDKSAPGSTRVSAARGVLDAGLRLTEMVTLAQRVADLEASLATTVQLEE